MVIDVDIELKPEPAGDLAARIMVQWPGLEVEAHEHGLCFCLNVGEDIDGQLGCLETILQAIEQARNLPDIPIVCWNRSGPDAPPERICVGRFLITSGGGGQPSNEQIPDHVIPLRIEAGPAFGTGGHPTTILVLSSMEDFFSPGPGFPSREGCRVLDIGTGSGILALAAAGLGAGPITAVDPSEAAVLAARCNFEENNPEARIELACAGADQVEGVFDLILANLVPSVLLKTAKELKRLLTEDGVAIVSGFSDFQAPQVVKAMTRQGLVSHKSYSKSGWSALTLVRDG